MCEVDVLLEKLHLALVCLASGSGPVQDRLADAYEGALADLVPDDFPSELAADFELVRQEILHHAPGVTSEGEPLDNATARRLARKIVSLYDRLTHPIILEAVGSE